MAIRPRLFLSRRENLPRVPIQHIFSSRSERKSRERLVRELASLNESGLDQPFKGEVGWAVKSVQAGPSELVPIPLAIVLPDRFQENPLARCEGCHCHDLR